MRDYAPVAFVSAQISLFISQSYNFTTNDIKRLKRANKHLGNRAAGNEPDKKHQRTGKRQERSCLKFEVFDRIVKK